MSILDNLAFQPGDELTLKDWHEFDWYWDGDDRAEHDPIWIEPGTLLEVYAIGKLNMDEPYYTFELSHHIHGDITIDVAASEAEKIFVLRMVREGEW
ncbi:MAG: hypothetical protein ACQEXX_01125 [Bacillota bacterium]